MPIQLRMALALSTLLAVANCASDRSPSIPDGDPPQVVVFSVEGNATDTGVLPIFEETPNPSAIDSTQSGGFSINWMVQNGQGDYIAELFLNKLNGNERIVFHQLTCGDTSAACGTAASLICHFDKSNWIYCSDSDGKDLTNWLDQLPESVVMGVHAYRSGGGSIQTTTIELR